jgi:HEAT repeats
MTIHKRNIGRLAVALAMALGWAVAADALAPESKRLVRAKDFMADEQWSRAIDELRLAVADPKEPRRDEALYWLAHSMNQSGDPAAAVETIGQLEREFTSSIWVKPARSLRVEIAVRLNRKDVLWWTATPPLPPTPPPATHPTKVAAPTPRRPPKLPPPAPLPPPPLWVPETFDPDLDLQIQALGGLMRTDAEKAIPILRTIAFESEDTGQACRAVFVLAQSGRPEAHATVVQVAKTGPVVVRVAAVKELGRFGGPEASKELLQVYTTANDIVKKQVVKSLGERSEKVALQRIVESEKDGDLRYTAIVSLGKAGGSEPLVRMYRWASFPTKQSIIIGLFNARDEEGLLRIAQVERDGKLRLEAHERLRLLGTPKAKEYLQNVSEKR